jgi:WD40 repeat protein
MFLDNPDYSSAVFSPDGRYVAASHRDGVVRMWDVRTGRLVRRVRGHAEWVYGVAFMPDGKGLMSGGWDKTLKYWDITSLNATRSYRKSKGVEEQSRPEREFTGHTVSFVVLSFHANHPFPRFTALCQFHCHLSRWPMGCLWLARSKCSNLGHAQRGDAMCPQPRPPRVVSCF